MGYDLSRFEEPQMVHNLLLWKTLKAYEAAWEQQSSLPEIQHIARQIFHIFLEPSAECNTGEPVQYAEHGGDKIFFQVHPSDYTPGCSFLGELPWLNKYALLSWNPKPTILLLVSLQDLIPICQSISIILRGCFTLIMET